MASMRVAAAGDVAAGTGTVVAVGGRTLALFNIEGAFHAIDNTCTHAGCALGEGTVEGTVVTCPCHGSMFDITTGAVVGPPAQRPVTAYRVRVQGGDVLVELPNA